MCEKPAAVLHNGPHGVQVVNTGPDHTFSLNEEVLKELLLQDDIKDRAVVVLSVAGAFRKGKSFLLAFLLRYLKQKYVSQDVTDWLGGDEEPLQGFNWRGGSERDTTGILMWSEIFKATLNDGRKVAIIILDSQGAFDRDSTVRDNATVFALATMLSSVLIYNVSQNVQENDLQHLQLFTEYGRLALEDSDRTPFQRLLFLVRDWSYPYEAPYGADGGRSILQKNLRVSKGQHPQLQSLRKHIQSCFSAIDCFLMPHPGMKVATSLKFDGRLKDIDVEFKRSLQQLVPMLLSPQNLVPKTINGEIVLAKDLMQYFESYMKIFKGNTLPEPKSMLQATAEANNLAAAGEAKELYTKLMEEVCGGDKPYLQPALLEAEHERVKDTALASFHAKRKMGGQQFSHTYFIQLTRELDERFVELSAQNDTKNIFNWLPALHTPVTFCFIALVLYVLGSVLGLVGLHVLDDFCTFAMGLALLTLVLWAYIRYTGLMRATGMRIDRVANVIWNAITKLPRLREDLKQMMSTVKSRVLFWRTTSHMINGKQKRRSRERRKKSRPK